jgi:hypothetical protein
VLVGWSESSRLNQCCCKIHGQMDRPEALWMVIVIIIVYAIFLLFRRR